MKKFFLLIVLLVLIFGGLGAWWINGISPANSNDQTEQSFSIGRGEGVRQIANNLKEQGLIRDPIIFYFIVKQQNADAKIQAGEFRVSPAMSAFDIVTVLQTATNDVRITVPEGKRAEEIAEILQEHFKNYQPSWKDSLVANEGYLFPDTYSFTQDATIDTIIKTMRANFEKKYASIPQSNKPFTKQQIVIIASMVEREAKFAEDRPLVASVIFNRLKQNTPLYLDATIQYALGYQPAEKSWWKKNLTESDLQINSPYNTRVNTGLPPGPISNPGLDVLNAVVNAPETNYLYYVSDKSGHNHYSKTLDEHNADIEKYGLN